MLSYKEVKLFSVGGTFLFFCKNDGVLKLFCKCNYIFFTRLAWSGDCEETFYFRVEFTPTRLSNAFGGNFTPFLNAERQAGKPRKRTFLVSLV